MPEFDDIYDPGYYGLDQIYGENVTYFFTGGSRVVSAMVDRETPAVGEDGMPTRVIVITVKNSSSGIEAHSVSKVNDYIMVEKRRGETPKRVSILDVSDSVSGVTVLTCR